MDILTIKIATYIVTVMASLMLVTFQKQSDTVGAKLLTICIFFMKIAGCVLLFKNHYFGSLQYMSVTIVTVLIGWLLFGRFTGNAVNAVKFIILLIVASGVTFLSL
jgi:hypothetical protein